MSKNIEVNNITVQTRISPELKQEAEEIFNQIGLSTSEAIRMFLQQTVNSQGLPFRPKIKKPNYETLLAMQEIEEDKTTKHKSLSEFKKHLKKI